MLDKTSNDAQKPTKKPTKESGYTKTNFTDYDDLVELSSASLKLVMRVNFDLVLDNVILVWRCGLRWFCEITKSQSDGSTKEPTRWGMRILERYCLGEKSDATVKNSEKIMKKHCIGKKYMIRFSIRLHSCR